MLALGDTGPVKGASKYWRGACDPLLATTICVQQALLQKSRAELKRAGHRFLEEITQ